MLLQITPSERHAFTARLDQMYQQRARVFKNRLDWNVHVQNGRELDQYDVMDPTYLLYIGHDGILRGSIRLLPTTNTNMLRDTFPQLLDGANAPQSQAVWESSRFCVETEGDLKTTNSLSKGCVELFAGMIEFGLSRGLDKIVTVTDVLVERILRRAGWNVSRIGTVHKIGDSKAVALDMPVDLENLHNLRAKSGLFEPVLWTLPTGPQLAPRREALGEAQNIYSSLTYLKQQAESMGLSDIASSIAAAQSNVTTTMVGEQFNA